MVRFSFCSFIIEISTNFLIAVRCTKIGNRQRVTTIKLKKTSIIRTEVVAIIMMVVAKIKMIIIIYVYLWKLRTN